MIIFRYLWSVWCIIWFALSSSFAVIGYRVILAGNPSHKKLSKALWWSRVWAKWLMSGFGIFIRTKRIERVSGLKNAIYISNHQSFLDIPTCAIANPNKFRFLSKAEIRKMPFVGYVLKRIYYTVDRTSQDSRKASMKLMEEGISTGFPVHLYIEGTRNYPGTGQTFLPFQKGASLLAKATSAPVVPLYIANSKDFLGKSFTGVKPGIIHAIWGEPIYFKATDSVQQINSTLLSALHDLKQELEQSA